MKDEKRIVELAQSGDNKAFEVLVRYFMRHVYATSLGILKNHHDADEAAQNTFIKAYSGLKKFKGKSSIKTWLTRIAINQSKDLLRKRKAHEPIKEIEHYPDTKGDSLSRFIKNEEKRQLERALDSLPEKQRLVVFLRLKGDFSFNEISQTLKISMSAAKTNFHYGIRRIKDELINK